VLLVTVIFICANNLVVVGDQEKNGREVNVRNRDDTSTQDRGRPIPLDEAVKKLIALRDERGTSNPFPAEAKPAAAQEQVKKA